MGNKQGMRNAGGGGGSWGGNLTTVTYLQSFSVSAKENQPYDIDFKSDGTKLYVYGDQYDSVQEYDLSTAWNITSATWLQSTD